MMNCHLWNDFIQFSFIFITFDVNFRLAGHRQQNGFHCCADLGSESWPLLKNRRGLVLYTVAAALGLAGGLVVVFFLLSRDRSGHAAIMSALLTWGYQAQPIEKSQEDLSSVGSSGKGLPRQKSVRFEVSRRSTFVVIFFSAYLTH